MTAGVRLAPKVAAFYGSQSTLSDSGELAGRYAGLPRDVAELAVSVDDVPFEAARRLFAENDGPRTPATVLSYAPFNGPRQVSLR
jgi:hypothetical protein